MCNKENVKNNVYEKRWNMIKEIIDIQTRYQSLYIKNELTKKNICELCIPFRDKYNLQDHEVLKIANGYCGFERIIQFVEDSIPKE